MVTPGSILLRSQKLSTALTSVMANALEKIEIKKQPGPSRLQASTAPTRDSWRAKKLQKELNNAALAEAPTDPKLILENEYPAVRSLRSDIDIGDGLWICCHCHHENIVRHWTGPHPFKFVACNQCDHKICSDCQATEILTPWTNGSVDVLPPQSGHEVRYCQVCTTCGLSHRAKMLGTTLSFQVFSCAGCGSSSWVEDWPQFYLGSVEPYRRDPDASFVKLVDPRAKDT